MRYRSTIVRILAAACIVMQVNLLAQTVDEGISLVAQKKYDQAKKVFEKIVEKNDNDAEAHFRLGMIFLDRGYKSRNVDDAVDEIEKAVDLNPKNAEYQFRYGVALGEKTQHAGMIKKAFLAPKVKTAFLRAVELDPRLVQARIGLAQYYLMAPSIMGGDEEEGWKQLDEVIKQDEVLGRVVRASMLMRAKKNEGAEKEYKILVQTYPKEWRAWKGYGYFFLQSDRSAEAMPCFQQYIILRPDTADSYQSLAEALLKKGEIDQAIANLNMSLSIDKDFVPAIISLGEAYQAKGLKREAKENYQRAIAIAQNEYYKNQAEQKLKEVE
jgi:Tfp pilus assembly protein PilF